MDETLRTTVLPDGITTSSVFPGTVPNDQFAAVVQSKFPPTVVEPV